MKTRLIPRTTLTASVLCLGTAEFGSAVDDSTAEKIIESYLDAGGNVLDTAEIYAAWLKNGEHRSETFLGAWLRKQKSRDRLIISTKGAHPRLDAMDKPRMSKHRRIPLHDSGKRLFPALGKRHDRPGLRVGKSALSQPGKRGALQTNQSASSRDRVESWSHRPGLLARPTLSGISDHRPEEGRRSPRINRERTGNPHTRKHRVP
jgi:hypothetical protein